MRPSSAGILIVSTVLALGLARAEVAVTGVDGRLLENVLAHLSLDAEPCDAQQVVVERKYRAARDAIRLALEALGYYEPDIAQSLEYAADCWHASFTINPGEPVRIRNLDLRLTGEAASDTSFATATVQPLRAGAPLDHGQYERLKQTWLRLAAERGYFEARLETHRIDVHIGERAADITLHFDSGPRYRFGAVNFRQGVLPDGLLRGYLPFASGDWYDEAALEELHAALSGSGYFEAIRIDPQAPDSIRRVTPIDLVLTPAPRKVRTYGIGFSTDTGVSLQLGRSNRRFNDRGHQFDLHARLSQVISEVVANYRVPLRNPREEWLHFDAGIKSEDTESSESDIFSLGARRLNKGRKGFIRTDMLSMQIEDYDVADQRGRSRLLMPQAIWRRVQANNPLRVEHGSRLQLQVLGASDSLGSDTTFLQTIAAAKWIRPLHAGRMLVRGQIGVTAIEELDELPASVRFFAGGDDSVRGYGFEELGPVNDDGEVMGGSSLLTASFEYEHALRERWAVAFFADAGNAFDGSAVALKIGAGFGARWRSPLGPVRLDVAHPFDDPENDWRVHITLGPDL